MEKNSVRRPDTAPGTSARLAARRLTLSGVQCAGWCVLPGRQPLLAEAPFSDYPEVSHLKVELIQAPPGPCSRSNCGQPSSCLATGCAGGLPQRRHVMLWKAFREPAWSAKGLSPTGGRHSGHMSDPPLGSPERFCNLLSGRDPHTEG